MKIAVTIPILAIAIWGYSDRSIQPALAQSQPTVQQSPLTANNLKLELIDAGAAPRRELKFRPTVNRQQTMQMSMNMSMDMQIGQTMIPKTPIPKMVLKVDANVSRIDPNGDIHCSFIYSDIQAIADRDTTPEVLAAMQKTLKSLIGIKLDLVMSSNGQIKSKNLIVPKNIDPTMKQALEQFDRSMEQLSAQLPVGAVGLGAKWRVNNSLRISGIQFQQSVVSEIVALDETGLTIKTQVFQSAPPQNFPIPNAGKGVTGKITSLISQGEGRYSLRFDTLLPLTGRSTSTTDSRVSIQTSSTEPPTNTITKVAIDLNVVSK
jgi:hypothetical protein